MRKYRDRGSGFSRVGIPIPAWKSGHPESPPMDLRSVWAYWATSYCTLKTIEGEMGIRPARIPILIYLDQWGLDPGICRRDLPNLEIGSLTCRGTNLASILVIHFEISERTLYPRCALKSGIQLKQHFNFALCFLSWIKDTRARLLDQILAIPQSRLVWMTTTGLMTDHLQNTLSELPPS